MLAIETLFSALPNPAVLPVEGGRLFCWLLCPSHRAGAGRSYVQIALEVRLSHTGVFDICKRHAAVDSMALRNAPGGRSRGAEGCTTFNAPLDAKTLIAFLRGLNRGASKKVFWIMDDRRVA